MRSEFYAGYRLTSRRPASSAVVEHWWAEGPDGPAEVYLGPEMLVRRARALPVWGPFAGVVTGRDGLRSYVVVPGKLTRSVDDLRELLSPGACVALAWHLAAALAEIHDRGGAHGALHPGWTGVDAEGRLTIRPALTATVRSEPDTEATAQATDCIQLASIFEALQLERLDESGLSLLMRGLSRDRARLRLQPGRAVRQSLSYLLHRHPDWSSALTDTLGSDWRTERVPRAVANLPVESAHPWAGGVVHIPRVGGSSTSASVTASIDLSAVAAGVPQSPGMVAVSSSPEKSSRAIVVQTGSASKAQRSVSEGGGLQVRVRRAEAPASVAVKASASPVRASTVRSQPDSTASDAGSFEGSGTAKQAASPAAIFVAPRVQVRSARRVLPGASGASSERRDAPKAPAAVTVDLTASKMGFAAGDRSEADELNPVPSAAAVSSAAVSSAAVSSAAVSSAVDVAEAGVFEAVSSEAVSSEAVSSEAVSSEAVSSEAVSSEAVSSEAVSSEAVSSEAASSEARVFEAVSSEAGVFEALSSEAVSSEAVSSEAVSSEAVSSEAVSSEAVSSEAVSSEAVSSEAGVFEAGVVEAALFEAVSSEAGVFEAVSSEAVSSEAVSSEAVSSEAVSSEAVSSEAVSSEAGVIEAGVFEAGVVEAALFEDVSPESASSDAASAQAGPPEPVEIEAELDHLLSTAVEAELEHLLSNAGFEADSSPAGMVDDEYGEELEAPGVPPELSAQLLPRGEPLGEPPSVDSWPPEPAPAAKPQVSAFVPPPMPRERVVVVSSAVPAVDSASDESFYADDEQTAVTRVPEPVREALKRLDAGRTRNLAVGSGGRADAGVAPSAPPTSDGPTDQSAALGSPEGPSEPRWAGLAGVTGDVSRDSELGSGKWEETARPLDELRKEMGTTPVRAMEALDPSRGNWPMLVVAVVALVALLALWVYTQSIS